MTSLEVCVSGLNVRPSFILEVKQLEEQQQKGSFYEIEAINHLHRTFHSPIFHVRVRISTVCHLKPLDIKPHP